MDHIGIDVHKRESQIYILAEGGEVFEQRIRTEPERFAAVLGTRHRARILIDPFLGPRQLDVICRHGLSRSRPGRGREIPAMDVLGLEEGGHGIATKEGQVAAKDQAVKAGESPLDDVRVFGDELVHSRIAHELRRESTPPAIPCQRAGAALNLRSRKTSDPSPRTPTDIFDRGPGRQPAEMPGRSETETAQPGRLGLVAAARPRCETQRP